MSSSKIELLNSKIRQFLKKFYLDKLYKGIILFVIVLLATFIAFSLFEYFSYSNTVVRSILFYSFIALAAGIGIAYIIIPALKISGLGKQLTNEVGRNHIVGQHTARHAEEQFTVVDSSELAIVVKMYFPRGAYHYHYVFCSICTVFWQIPYFVQNDDVLLV